MLTIVFLHSRLRYTVSASVSINDGLVAMQGLSSLPSGIQQTPEKNKPGKNKIA